MRLTTLFSLLVLAMTATATAVTGLAVASTTTTSAQHLTIPTETSDCNIAIMLFQNAHPSPILQPLFSSYMHEYDPFAHQCLVAPIPGISLIERNGFWGDWVGQAEWYNAAHAALQDWPAECREAAIQEEEPDAWRLVGLKEGLPRTWEEVEKMLKCEDVRKVGNGTGNGTESKVADGVKSEGGAVRATGTSAVVFAVVVSGMGLLILARGKTGSLETKTELESWGLCLEYWESAEDLVFCSDVLCALVERILIKERNSTLGLVAIPTIPLAPNINACHQQ
ncbi:hypothetical protein K458DRAFT_400698 [Lentithecium fluviatile CBS 122367]|uniref:Uncharacterized protein n=1 Tax=Lentithecium fluviatile CBS 122367 TaxID=1168545 RepID=A0A6G1JEC4_9PLEO|nr:hypothetical protein K458DRAFT_400698 [Lentithecium fluviatile CBS 122367]